jgi:hypothetical protein
MAGNRHKPTRDNATVTTFKQPGLLSLTFAVPSQVLKTLALVMVMILVAIISAQAEPASVKAKQFPASHFYLGEKISMSAKAKILAKIDATLQKLNQEGYGLMTKGSVLEKISPRVKTYDKLTILDASGLIVIAHRVPNLYYQYPGKTPLNPNIFLIVKKARVNFPESYIRYGYVVEGDYLAYPDKYVEAIMADLRRGLMPKPQPLAQP